MSAIDYELVRHALHLAQENAMNEVELSLGGSKFSAVIDRRSSPQKKSQPDVVVASVETVPLSPPTRAVKATSVGVFRLPKVPLIAGATVEIGDVIGSIFALGITNDVHTAFAGTVADILVEDGDPVEYGQTLLEVLG